MSGSNLMGWTALRPHERAMVVAVVRRDAKSFRLQPSWLANPRYHTGSVDYHGPWPAPNERPPDSWDQNFTYSTTAGTTTTSSTGCPFGSWRRITTRGAAKYAWRAPSLSWCYPPNQYPSSSDAYYGTPNPARAGGAPLIWKDRIAIGIDADSAFEGRLLADPDQTWRAAPILLIASTNDAWILPGEHGGFRSIMPRSVRLEWSSTSVSAAEAVVGDMEDAWVDVVRHRRSRNIASVVHGAGTAAFYRGLLNDALEVYGPLFRTYHMELRGPLWAALDDVAYSLGLQ